MKNMKTLDQRTNRDQDLYEIEFTPKGTKETILVYVYAKNSWDASNWMILNHIWGKQHEIRLHLNSAFLNI